MSEDRERPYVVIALLRGWETKKEHEDCRVIPYGEPYVATHSQVYGPASQRECEKWVAKNCDKSGGAATR